MGSPAGSEANTDPDDDPVAADGILLLLFFTIPPVLLIKKVSLTLTLSTDILGYNDTFGTNEKCHC